MSNRQSGAQATVDYFLFRGDDLIGRSRGTTEFLYEQGQPGDFLVSRMGGHLRIWQRADPTKRPMFWITSTEFDALLPHYQVLLLLID